MKSEWDFSNTKTFRKCKIKRSAPSYEGNFVSSDSLGQKIGDKLMKWSEIGFSVECFTADFLQLFTKKRQSLAFGWTAGYSPSNLSISGIFLLFRHLSFLCNVWFSQILELCKVWNFAIICLNNQINTPANNILYSKQ